MPSRLASKTPFRGMVGDVREAEDGGLDVACGGCGNCPMLTVLRIVCGVDTLLAFCVFFKVGSSGVEDPPWLLGLIEGRDGVLSFEGRCA